MDIIFPYSESKIKPYLKMAIQRLQIAKNKKITLSKHEKREIGQLLSKQKEELARIKTEHIIREDFTIEAYEMLELLCELVHERIRLITNSDGRSPPDDLREAMATLIWASKRVTIEELNEVTNQLKKKYGSKFVDEANDNFDSIVNVRLINKLSNASPSATLVLSYMREIAREYKIDWEPAEVGIPEGSQAFTTPTGFSIPMAPGTELRSVYQRHGADGDLAHAVESSSASSSSGMQLPPPPMMNQGAKMNKPSPSAGHHDDNIPMATATVIPDQPLLPQYIPPPESSPSYSPTQPPPSYNSTASAAMSEDDSFAALQARLAALRDL